MGIPRAYAPAQSDLVMLARWGGVAGLGVVWMTQPWKMMYEGVFGAPEEEK